MRIPTVTNQSRNRARKTLVFHIGDHKTGSTSIQQAFAKDSVTFPDTSVFYSRRLNHNYLRAHCAAYAKPQAPDMPPKARIARKKSVHAFNELAKKIENAPDQISLVSAESLESVNPAVFHDVVTRFFDPIVDNIRVVAYVRPHGPRLLSNFAEQIKIGKFYGNLMQYFEHTLTRDRFFYLPRFQAWRDLFSDRFILRPMIRNQLSDGSILHDFIRHGLGLSAFQVGPVDQANSSLCLEDLMRLKVLQSHQRHQPQILRHALGWEFAGMVGAMEPAETRTKLSLERSVATKIHAAYLRDAQAMDTAFFAGMPLMEDELNMMLETATNTGQSTDPADWFSASEMRSLRLLSHTIAAMTANNPDSWPSFWRTKREDALHETPPRARIN